MATQTEKNIIAHRRTQGVVVPKLMRMFEQAVDIREKDDVKFLHDLAMKGVWRESGREYKPMFSPSALSSCMRKVYLHKHWRDLGLTRVELANPEAHQVFSRGDWLHLEWQWKLWRLSKFDPTFQLIDCEVPVESKRGDHGGTIDVVCMSDGIPYILDVKGLNFRGAQKVDRGEISDAYKIQVPDYIMLYNSSREKHIKEMRAVTGRIAKGILLVEAKSGPDPHHPLALREVMLDLDTHLPEVLKKLEALRAHEARQEIPQPECDSLRGYQYLGCPFAEFCREEVKERQTAAKKRQAESRNPSEFRVRVPERSGSNRTRRLRSRG